MKQGLCAAGPSRRWGPAGAAFRSCAPVATPAGCIPACLKLPACCREKEAHNRAVVLEMIGDLPEAEAKPPPNMLFICKLNPVGAAGAGIAR